MAQIPAISKIKKIRISLADHGLWNRSLVSSSALLLTVTVHERCLCGHVQENQFLVLSVHSSVLDSHTEIHSVLAASTQKIQVMRSHPFRISGKIAKFETSFTFCSFTSGDLPQFVAESPSLHDHERYTSDLCGILLRCAVGELYFDIWIRNESRGITDAAFRAASLYDLKYYDKISLVSSLQLYLWDFTATTGDEQSSDEKKIKSPSLLRVVLSSDSNPDYGFCLPVAALFWKKILGFNVTVLLVARKWDRSLECIRGECRWMRVVRAALDELGVESVVLGEGRHPPGLVAQVSRLYAAVRRRPGTAERESKEQTRDAEQRCQGSNEYEQGKLSGSDEYLVVSDADVLPLSRDAFMRRDWRRAVHLFNAFEPGLFRPCLPHGRREGHTITLEPDGPTVRNARWGVAGDAVGMFAMSHVGASDGVWRSVMGLPGRRRLEALWRQRSAAAGPARANESKEGQEGGAGPGRPGGEVDEALTWWIGRRLDADLGPDGPDGRLDWQLGDVGTGLGGMGRRAGGERCGGWWYDQRLLSARLHGWACFPGRAELIPRDTARDRVDRSRWVYSATPGRVQAGAPRRAGRGWAWLGAGWSQPAAVDAHVPLPLHGAAAWGAVQGLVRAMVGPADVAWLEDFRARFRLEVPA